MILWVYGKIGDEKYQVIDKGGGKIYEQKVEYYICAN